MDNDYEIAMAEAKILDNLEDEDATQEDYEALATKIILVGAFTVGVALGVAGYKAIEKIVQKVKDKPKKPKLTIVKDEE